MASASAVATTRMIGVSPDVFRLEDERARTHARSARFKAAAEPPHSIRAYFGGCTFCAVLTGATVCTVLTGA